MAILANASGFRFNHATVPLQGRLERGLPKISFQREPISREKWFTENVNYTFIYFLTEISENISEN